MRKKEDIKRYTADELRELRRKGESLTDWDRADSIAEEELERLIAEDGDEEDFDPDLTKAQIGMPQSQQSVDLWLDEDVVDWFQAKDKDYEKRINAVLRAYVDGQQKSKGQ